MTGTPRRQALRIPLAVLAVCLVASACSQAGGGVATGTGPDASKAAGATATTLPTAAVDGLHLVCSCRADAREEDDHRRS